MKKFGLLYGSTILLFIGVIILSGRISAQMEGYKHKKEEIASELNFEERLLSVQEYIPGFSTDDEKVALWQKLEKEAKAKYNGALFFGGILVLLVLAFVAVNVGVSKKKPWKYQIYGLVMTFSALSFLYTGLQSPFIEVMAYNKDLSIDIAFTDITFDGRTHYWYQNKSIFGIIEVLYTGGNFLVAIAVAIFSIIFPLIKSSVSIFVLHNPSSEKSSKRYQFVRNLGKWSMADVFVAAIFLALFAYSNMDVGVETGSETLIGTYFYLLFVMLSINSGQYLKKSMKQVENNTAED